MKHAVRLATAVLVVACLVMLVVPGRGPGRPARVVERTPDLPRQFLGAGSCGSSGCHGADVAGHEPWQSAVAVWATRDPHAGAARVLHEPLALRIVELLAARDPGAAQAPAPENRACIGCHAPAPGALASEGVGCEACHGPAGDWILAHTLPAWRTAGNAAGMVDLADPFTCASECAGCHVGGPPTAAGLPREVSHDLIAAGHPRLAFELRSSKAAEPPHWRDRFATAGAPLDQLGEWALGRLGTLDTFLAQVERQSLAAVGSHDGAMAGCWPEFTAFDCYGCHRPPVPAIDRGRGQPSGGRPRLVPLVWSGLDLVAGRDAAGRLTEVQAALERDWWRRPDAAVLADGRAAVAAARTEAGKRLAETSAGEAAQAVATGIDGADWDAAAAAYFALVSLVDRQASRGRDVAAARDRLAALRTLLEFPTEHPGAPGVRYDSPRGLDAAALTAAVAETVAAIAATER